MVKNLYTVDIISKSDADKFIKYKTGDMKDTKDIKIILEPDLTKPTN